MCDSCKKWAQRERCTQTMFVETVRDVGRWQRIYHITFSRIWTCSVLEISQILFAFCVITTCRRQFQCLTHKVNRASFRKWWFTAYSFVDLNHWIHRWSFNSLFKTNQKQLKGSYICQKLVLEYRNSDLIDKKKIYWSIKHSIADKFSSKRKNLETNQELFHHLVAVNWIKWLMASKWR